MGLDAWAALAGRPCSFCAWGHASPACLLQAWLPLMGRERRGQGCRPTGPAPLSWPILPKTFSYLADAMDGPEAAAHRCSGTFHQAVAFRLFLQGVHLRAAAFPKRGVSRGRQTPTPEQFKIGCWRGRAVWALHLGDNPRAGRPWKVPPDAIHCVWGPRAWASPRGPQGDAHATRLPLKTGTAAKSRPWVPPSL